MADEAEAQEPLEGEFLPVLRNDYEGDEPNLGGRPRLYTSSDQFNEAVDAYYQAVQQIPNEPLTITGLCLFMGFSGRRAMFKYASYDGFGHAVARARTMIEYGYEKAVIVDKNNAAGRLLSSIAGDDFWKQTDTLEVKQSHETWLERLK